MRAHIVWVLLLVGAAAAAAQEPASRATSRAAASSDPAAADVLAFEREMEAAVVRGDVSFLDRVCTADFSFTHGDGWTTGGQPLRVENKAQWLAAVGKRRTFRHLDSVGRLHGDIAITYRRYARFKAGTGTAGIHRLDWASLRATRRQLAMRTRTVHGPTYMKEESTGSRQQ